MWILVFLFLVIVPFFVGCTVGKVADPFEYGLLDTYLDGVLMLFVLSGLVQFVTVLFHRAFGEYIIIYAVLLTLLFIPGVFLFGWGMRKDGKNKIFLEKGKGFFRFWFADRASQVLTLLNILIFVFCIARVLFGTVDLHGDFTMETVRTTLETDSIYEYDSFTGQVLNEGMPIRQKILTLPFFLAMLCEIAGVNPGILIYKVFPCFLLMWTAMLCAKWGSLLFPKQREKESGFLMLTGCLLLFGDYAQMAPASLLLHQGFTGNALCALFVIPYTLYLCLRKKWVLSLLCIAAEIFLIWTTYGFGYCFLIVAFFGIWEAGKKIYQKKRKE